MRSRLSLSLFALLAFAPLSFADFITGHVVDSNGAPVAGVNIDAIRVSNGNDINLSNDGTDANGFFLTTIPPNVYDLHFIPPAPPATTHIAMVLKNVVVTGTKNLGTIVLPAGVSLSGHIQTTTGTPVGQVTLGVIDGLTGDPLVLATRKSDAFGNFNLAVPKHAIELQLDATSVLIATLASKSINAAPTVNTNLGNIVLKPGFVVSGTTVRAAGGAAVNAVDLDFIDTTTGVKLYTPNDNSNALGNFSVVVPAGNYDVEFCSPFATQLVGKRLTNRTVSGTLSLGSVPLEQGFVLTGTVRAFDSTLQVNADLDVRDQIAGTKVVTCADNTNASGVYSIIVPAGTLKVTFHPPTVTALLGNDAHKNYLVTGGATLNGTLPFCAAPNNYGTGLPGTGGLVPHLTTSGGSPVSDNGGFALELQNARGAATGFLMVSLGSASRSVLGGTLLVNPSLGFSLPVALDGTAGVAGAGSKHLPTPLASVIGLDVYAQFFARDSAAAQGWSFSEGLHFRVCR